MKIMDLINPFSIRSRIILITIFWEVTSSADALPADAAAVFAVPVYGGRVAPAALERLREIRGEGTPAVVGFFAVDIGVITAGIL